MRDGSQGSISNYDAPWYDDLAAMATAIIYGPGANAQQYAGVEQFTGPQNPFNLPAQAQQGVNTAVEGYDAGNYGQMAGGAAQAGLAVSPLVAMMMRHPALRDPRIARQLNRAYPDEASAYGPRQYAKISGRTRPVPSGPQIPHGLPSADPGVRAPMILPRAANEPF